jgi:polar amino acid transport system permease protein
MVFIGAVFLAVLVAIMLGGALTTPWRLLRWPAAVVVEVVRGTSAIVQLFWVFFALPMIGINLPGLLAGILVLGINSGAYGAEVVRGALQAVERGQRDAAAALSLGPFATWWRIILPQAVPRMLPPFGNLAVELLKNTALVGLVGIADLTFQGNTLRSTSLNDWLLVETLALYAALAFVVVRVLRFVERRCGRWRATA